MKAQNPFFFLLTLIALLCLFSPEPPSRLPSAASPLLERLSLRQRVDLRVQNGIRNARLRMNPEERSRILEETLSEIRSLRKSFPRQNARVERGLDQQEKSLKDLLRKERIAAL